MDTFSAKADEVDRKWFVVDATDLPLGRLASNVASVIRGKHKPVFTPHVDTGDFVIVINAEKIKLTGAKLDGKFRYWHSQYPGGFGKENYRTLLGRRPELAIEEAVYGMLPKNRLGRTLRLKLKVYKGPLHPHAAQRPEPLNVRL
jgi:large subunit ribosomal protein L13